MQAVVTDAAGNTATDDATHALTIDTVNPAVTVAPLTTTSTAPTLTGTVSDAAPSSGIASVTVVVGTQTFLATVSGNAWSATPPAALANGTYNIQVTAADKAGNTATGAAPRLDGRPVSPGPPSIRFPTKRRRSIKSSQSRPWPTTPRAALPSPFSLVAPGPRGNNDRSLTPVSSPGRPRPARKPSPLPFRSATTRKPPLTATRSFQVAVSAVPVIHPPVFATTPPPRSRRATVTSTTPTPPIPAAIRLPTRSSPRPPA